ncbi:hypothetical protein SETIT_5G074900v2 [Setaria italica]|uniref:Uncharacterized protein n=1 Tax=Setaria italica TaxID=4555 RepID=A0A368R290_SETIT|nr:hypothetical protein SETIT_5G074900v2 [Setaria italica]
MAASLTTTLHQKYLSHGPVLVPAVACTARLIAAQRVFSSVVQQEPARGGGRGGRGRRPRRAAVGRRQLHPRWRLHHAAPRLPARAVAPEAPPPPPRRLPARARLQGPLQRHRRGQGGDRGDGGGARGDGGGDGEQPRRHHARRWPPRQELPLQRAEPVHEGEEPGVQGPRRPAARHGAGRLLERRAHTDRDHKLAHTTAEDPVPDVHVSAWRDMEKIEAEESAD